jgi:hypothetical protein
MDRVERIALTTLDSYCAFEGIQKIDFLKIDAEGHDLEVLKGASTMLAEGRITYVQFEFGGANIDSRTFLRDFVTLLTPRYSLWRLLSDGVELLEYSEREEIFITTNFLAELNWSDRGRGLQRRGANRAGGGC